MNKGINKVIIVGNLGSDPDVRYMPNGSAVAGFSVATSESWKDKTTGETKESTEWHRVVVFGKLAEVAGQYLSKGSQVYIEGQLKTKKWQDKQGNDRYTTEVVVQGFNGVMQMLGGKTQQQYNQEPQGGFKQEYFNDGIQKRKQEPQQQRFQPQQNVLSDNALKSDDKSFLGDDIPF